MHEHDEDHGDGGEGTTRPSATATTPNAEQARLQLVTAAATSVGSRRDASLHALATAGLGVIVGAYVAVSEVVDGRGPWDHLLLGGYVLLLAALGFLQRSAHSAPRNTRTAVRWASVPTVLLAFAAIFVMNAWGHSVRVAPGYLVLAAVVVAAPLLVAGATIVRGSRR